MGRFWFHSVVAICLCWLPRWLPMLAPKVAEAMALRKLISICWKLGLSNILLKRDCLELIQVVNSHRSWDDKLKFIIHDILHMLKNAQDWQVSFVPRDSNKAADHLAKLACNFPNDSIRIEVYMPRRGAQCNSGG